MVMIVYVVAQIVGMLASRTGFIGMRGGIQHADIGRAALALISTFMTISLFIWAFAVLGWYWPLALFLIGSIASGLLISRENWAAWYSASLLLDLITVALGGYLWIWHSPF